MERLVVGLTGGVGAGKTTIGSFLAEKGLKVIAADVIGHGLLIKGSPVTSALVDAFGPDILLTNGDIDRKALAAKAFETEEATEKLNAITHPAIIAKLKEELAAAPPGIIVIEAALVFEWSHLISFDVVVCVTADETLRRRRTKDFYDAEDFSRRSQRQIADEEKVARADIVVVNDGSLRELKVKSYELLNILEDIYHNILVIKEQVVI